MIGIFCRISVLYVLCVNYSVNKKVYIIGRHNRDNERL